MFEYRIDNAHAAYELMKEGWPTKIVSLVGPDLNFDLPKQGDHHLIKVFHDFEGPMGREELHGSIWDPGEDEIILPTKEMIYDVLEFCWDLEDDDRLLVHCHAGRSRSAAMLIGIIFDHLPSWSLDTAREAVRMVHEARPTMIPNRLMIKMMDEIMGNQDNELQIAVKEYWDACTLPGLELRTRLSGWRG